MSLDAEYQTLTSLPSLLTNGSVHQAIAALQPIPEGQSIKAAIRERYGERAAELISQICHIQHHK